jgi:trehalose 6-phosphate synthase
MARVGSVAVAERAVVIVSNRGPLSFRFDGDELVGKRGAGGLVSGLAPLVADTDTMWIAAAITDADRVAADRGVVEADGLRVRLLSLDPERFRMSYDLVCNAVLWFLHHGLFDLARRPRFDQHWREAWSAYRDVNRAFADAVATDAPPDAIVLVQDYHLTLLAPELAERRPDLRLVHFSHTPFAGPDLMRVLPSPVAAELLSGMAAHHTCGFHTARWARSFAESCRDLVGVEPPTFVAPLAPDPGDIGGVADSRACRESLADLDTQIGDRALIVRVDRIELSKNLLRGFLAFDDLLERHPRWRDRVVFAASCYPSREGLADYLAYRQEVEGLVRQVNDRWGTDSWTPILLDTSDDFPRSVAALRRYDVLLVNPIRDGLNLVAKEGPLVNERNGLVVLSTESGAWAELADSVRSINPFDITATADALAEALETPSRERAEEARRLRRLAAARVPSDWLADLVAAAG